MQVLILSETSATPVSRNCAGERTAKLIEQHERERQAIKDLIELKLRSNNQNSQSQRHGLQNCGKHFQKPMFDNEHL